MSWCHEGHRVLFHALARHWCMKRDATLFPPSAGFFSSKMHETRPDHKGLFQALKGSRARTLARLALRSSQQRARAGCRYPWISRNRAFILFLRASPLQSPSPLDRRQPVGNSIQHTAIRYAPYGIQTLIFPVGDCGAGSCSMHLHRNA